VHAEFRVTHLAANQRIEASCWLGHGCVHPCSQSWSGFASGCKGFRHPIAQIRRRRTGQPGFRLAQQFLAGEASACRRSIPSVPAAPTMGSRDDGAVEVGELAVVIDQHRTTPVSPPSPWSGPQAASPRAGPETPPHASTCRPLCDRRSARTSVSRMLFADRALPLRTSCAVFFLPHSAATCRRSS